MYNVDVIKSELDRLKNDLRDASAIVVHTHLSKMAIAVMEQSNLLEKKCELLEQLNEAYKKRSELLERSFKALVR